VDFVVYFSIEKKIQGVELCALLQCGRYFVGLRRKMNVYNQYSFALLFRFSDRLTSVQESRATKLTVCIYCVLLCMETNGSVLLHVQCHVLLLLWRSTNEHNVTNVDMTRRKELLTNHKTLMNSLDFVVQDGPNK